MDIFLEWYEDLVLVILIKVEDFYILGYWEIKVSYIWVFLIEEKWKNELIFVLYECINDVM